MYDFLTDSVSFGHDFPYLLEDINIRICGPLLFNPIICELITSESFRRVQDFYALQRFTS